jgi:hypothetical protein
MANRFFALLVGIDRYANPYQAPSLRGCVADIDATYALLVDRFHVPPEQVLRLTARADEDGDAAALPTRANIIAAWRDHLGQAAAGDVVFFHFSGHGSQARSIDPDEPDGYDETLVAHDSRTAGVFDLADKELALLIRQVERRGAQVLVFLDCCHAGGGSRAASRGPVRTCPPDDRIRPDAPRLARLRLDAVARRRPTPSGWLPLGKHVLLAACRDDELSYEYRVPNTEQWHGAASYFFHQALATATPETTWARIHDAILTQVHAAYPMQTPQLEGPGHLTLFGGAGGSPLGAVSPYLLVLAVEQQEYIKVNGGAAVGLTPGTRLAVYWQGDDMTGEPMAIAMVEEVAVDHAWAKLDRFFDAVTGARVKVLALGWSERPYTVRCDDALLRQAVTAGSPLGAAAEGTPLLRVVGSQDGDAAEFVVTVDAGCYVVTDGAGHLLWARRPPAARDGAIQMAVALEHMAIYRNIQRLRNPAPVGGLQGGIDLAAVVYDRAGRMGRADGAAGAGGLYDPGHSATVTAGQKLQLTIHNRTDEPVYLALFNLDAEYGVSRIYPSHAVNQKVEAQTQVVIDAITPRLSGPQPDRAVEILKVIATRAPMSFDVLQLPKLEEGDAQIGVRADEESPLGELLNAVRRRHGRDLSVELDQSAAAWTTAQLEIAVVAPPTQRPLPADFVRVAIQEEGGWSIEKPVGWQARFFLGDLAQTSRAVDRRTLRLPPALDNPAAAEVFRPVRVGEATPGAPWARPGAAVVAAVAATAEELAAITPANPLRIEMTVADEPGLAGVVPIAYDGRHYSLAGRPAEVDHSPSYIGGTRRLACDVQRLPTPVEGGAGAVTRDFKRAARLFFYKVFAGSLPPDTGLRQADLVDGRAVFRPVTADDVAKAQRVALMLHGFTGDTRWMVERVWSWVRSHAHYDLCLSFDFETFGTGIRRNAQTLAAGLAGLGFAKDNPVQLDIYCHSVGCLVARSLVELDGGDAYVDRVFMGGPPNAGTPLASGRNLLPWLANILVNLAGSVPPALIAHWLVERAAATGHGLSDMEPESRFLEELNAGWRAPAPVPYYVQIGDNSTAFAAWAPLVRQVMAGVDAGLDALFAADNDLLVGLNSARSLEGRWPRLEVQVLGVHHFQYFHSAEGQRTLARWLA